MTVIDIRIYLFPNDVFFNDIKFCTFMPNYFRFLFLIEVSVLGELFQDL